MSGFNVQTCPAVVLSGEQSTTHDFVRALAGESQSVTVLAGLAAIGRHNHEASST